MVVARKTWVVLVALPSSSSFVVPCHSPVDKWVAWVVHSLASWPFAFVAFAVASSFVDTPWLAIVPVTWTFWNVPYPWHRYYQCRYQPP